MQICDKLEWGKWVTPALLRKKPIHRWYVFPHSFSSELVHHLIDIWKLTPSDRILDPFSGASTTILAAKEKGIPAVGFDILPLSVFVGKTKVSNYIPSRIEKAWSELKILLKSNSLRWKRSLYPNLVEKALPGRILEIFEMIAEHVKFLSFSNVEKDFLYLALLSIIPKYSCAYATGGWLKWVEKKSKVNNITQSFNEQVQNMLQDVVSKKLPTTLGWNIIQADARRLPTGDDNYTAVITSPPYPNRHDYTRIFGVELMFGFINWEQNREIRYQSFHSHPEARPKRPSSDGYKAPECLINTLSAIKKVNGDSRIIPMLNGYFLDIFLCLSEVKRVSRQGAKIAFVLGNVQYGGESILVDEITAEIGEQVGLSCEEIIVVRYRGNSAQQMGKFGRRPSRESIIIFTKL